MTSNTTATSPPVRAKADPTAAQRGALIRATRIARGLTQLDLGKAVGVSDNSVAAWEKGKLPRLATRKRLAEVLGLDLADLTDDASAVATVHPLRVDPGSNQAAVPAANEVESFKQMLALGLRDGSFRDQGWLEAMKTYAGILGVPWAPEPQRRP